MYSDGNREKSTDKERSKKKGGDCNEKGTRDVKGAAW